MRTFTARLTPRLAPESERSIAEAPDESGRQPQEYRHVLGLDRIENRGPEEGEAVATPIPNVEQGKRGYEG